MPGCIEGNIRILLDHNLPRQLAEQLPAGAVSTARADLVDAILPVVKRHKFTQKELARIPDEQAWEDNVIAFRYESQLAAPVPLPRS